VEVRSLCIIKYVKINVTSSGRLLFENFKFNSEQDNKMVTAQLMQGLYNKRKFTMFHKNSKWPVNIFLKSTKSSLKMFLKGMPNLSICSLRAENCYVKHTVSSPSKLLVLRNSKRTCQNLQPTERPEWLHGRSERPEASMVCSAITHFLTQLTCFGSIAKIFL